MKEQEPIQVIKVIEMKIRNRKPLTNIEAEIWNFVKMGGSI